MNAIRRPEIQDSLSFSLHFGIFSDQSLTIHLISDRNLLADKAHLRGIALLCLGIW